MKAYQRVGKLSSFYDGMMTNSSFFGRLAIRYFWQLSDLQYIEFINQAFAGIPKNFSEKLLEVPIGTGVLSMPIYKNYRSRLFSINVGRSKIECIQIQSE